MNKRIGKGIARGEPFEIEVDGERILAYEGETIAAAMLAAGKLICRKTKITGEPRGIYCGIGVCMGCAMIVDGKRNALVCQTRAKRNCKVQKLEKRSKSFDYSR